MNTDRSALPKYQQLAELLLREIAAGRLRVGDRLPPERAMADDLGVAVGTLRKALASLTDKGVIARHHGSGNYIKNSGQLSGIYSFFRLERIDGGGLPRARVLTAERMKKPHGLPTFGAHDEAIRIRRLRLLDDVIVAAEEIWLDGDYAEHLEPEDLSESLYLYYREHLGLWIVGVEDRIGVGEVPDWAVAIGLAESAACGLVERVSLAQNGTRAEVSHTWFNPDRARYVSRSG